MINDMMRYYVVMSFADKLLEREVLSVEEYSAFSVETASRFSFKMPEKFAKRR